MYNKRKFNKKLLATVVASSALAGFSGLTLAQDGGSVEEVVVTGIRASLERSMDTKRDSAGVVDAITSEDMGKFPDTNLAESLQRITGVSIDRVNGEGSRITVRGFGGDNNMVTLNGRMMPAASTYGGGSGAAGTIGGATRAFDFADLASESVAGVEVYKTGKANIATGGIGATVNIKTAKPLDHDGFKASIGAKALSDSTNRTGSDITPEVSGLVSWSDQDSGFGIGLTASHQERDSGSSDISENNWNIGVWDSDLALTQNKGLYSFADGAKITNQPAEGQLYARPNDLRYAFSDIQRTRNNAQLTLQWAPTDKITGTVDYTYADNDILERRGESTSWLANGNSIDEVEFDTSGAVAAPLYIHETAGPRDQGYEQQLRHQDNTLNSVGFNLDFQVTDDLKLNFDAHDSKMKSLPVGPGKAGEVATSIATHSQVSHWLDFSGYAPLFGQVTNDGFLAGRDNGNGNGIDDVGDIGSQVVRVAYADQINEIKEYRLDGVLKFDNGHFDFGVQSRDMTNEAHASSRYMAMGDWGVANVGDIPADLITPYNLANFDSFNTAKSYQGGFKGNAEDIAASLINTYDPDGSKGYCVCYEPSFSNNDVVEEKTQSAYFQVGVQGELGDLPFNMLAGLRYETTDVSSSSLVKPPAYLLWQDDNDFQVDYTGQELQPFHVSASYDNLLPSFDFDIAFTDNLKGRFSASQTIARAPYGSLSASVSNFSSGGGSTANGAIRTADSSNPALLPLKSDNFDLSLEWYYGDSSYVSAGVFEKRVVNFIGTEKVTKQLFGIQDQTNANSPRVKAAVAALNAGNYGVNDASLFTMMAILDHPEAFPNGAADYDGTEAQHQAVATAYDITPRSDDVTSDWLVSQPTNNKEAKIYGAEFAVQHFFGESGFGVQANYTLVRGDVGFDDGAAPGVTQFALLGLSDTANLVGIYEKDGWQARIAYNWRGEFLRSASQGSSKNPIYTEAYHQIDATVSYELTDNLTISLEGINLTGEDRRDHGRTSSMLEYMVDLGPRYSLGARYTF